MSLPGNVYIYCMGKVANRCMACALRWRVQPAHANDFACEGRRISQRNAVVKNCLAQHAAGSLTVDKTSAEGHYVGCRLCLDRRFVANAVPRTTRELRYHQMMAEQHTKRAATHQK
jgi:hypothetical protein